MFSDINFTKWTNPLAIAIINDSMKFAISCPKNFASRPIAPPIPNISAVNTPIPMNSAGLLSAVNPIARNFIPIPSFLSNPPLFLSTSAEGAPPPPPPLPPPSGKLVTSTF